MQLAADELRLERHAVDPHELLGRGGPGRQHHVPGGRVRQAQPVAGTVHQHLREEEQLGDQLLCITNTVRAWIWNEDS